MRNLWPALCMAQKMGKKLERRKILQRKMPSVKISATAQK